MVISIKQAPPTKGENKAPAPEKNVVKVTEADNGKTIAVAKGKDIVVELPANATTGYQWRVLATSRSLGYPTQSYRPSESAAIGAGGTAQLAWSTKDSHLGEGGQHKVVLGYVGPGQNRPEKTFEFAIQLKAAH